MKVSLAVAEAIAGAIWLMVRYRAVDAVAARRELVLDRDLHREPVPRANDPSVREFDRWREEDGCLGLIPDLHAEPWMADLLARLHGGPEADLGLLAGRRSRASLMTLRLVTRALSPPRRGRASARRTGGFDISSR